MKYYHMVEEYNNIINAARESLGNLNVNKRERVSKFTQIYLSQRIDPILTELFETDNLIIVKMKIPELVEEMQTIPLLLQIINYRLGEEISFLEEYYSQLNILTFRLTQIFDK
jgi:hypothetical protein